MRYASHERMAKMLDELLVFTNICGRPAYEYDTSIVRDSLAEIAECRRANQNYPITVSLANFMLAEGLIE